METLDASGPSCCNPDHAPGIPNYEWVGALFPVFLPAPPAIDVWNAGAKGGRGVGLGGRPGARRCTQHLWSRVVQSAQKTCRSQMPRS